MWRRPSGRLAQLRRQLSSGGSAQQGRTLTSSAASGGDGAGQVVLVTGATGKVGTVFLAEYARTHPAGVIRALCNNRTLPETERLQVVRGSIGDREVCEEAMAGVTHVVHLATVKETPDLVMDVTVKGMFQLLEVRKPATPPLLPPPTPRRPLTVGEGVAAGAGGARVADVRAVHAHRRRCRHGTLLLQVSPRRRSAPASLPKHTPASCTHGAGAHSGKDWTNSSKSSSFLT